MGGDTTLMHGLLLLLFFMIAGWADSISDASASYNGHGNGNRISQSGRSLLQSGNSCPNNIPACTPRRCTTRVLGSREAYVCLRCLPGFTAVRGIDGSSIVQCVCPPGRHLSSGQCQDCQIGNYCPGGTSSIRNYGGQAISCNPPDAPNSGLTTKGMRSTRATDCVAKGGFVLPRRLGQPAKQCPVSTWSPNLNSLKSCLMCQSGLQEDPAFAELGGARDNRDNVCKVPPGMFWELNVVRECPAGMYREGYANITSKEAINCLSCPAGWTTQANGADGRLQCSKLLPGYRLTTAELGSTSGRYVPQGALQDQPTELCPLGYYFDGKTSNVYGCLRCPFGSITRQNGSSSLDDCVVPPGYFIRPNSKDPTQQTGQLVKCSTTSPNTTEEGYYRPSWKPYNNVVTLNGDGTDVCIKCGAGILSMQVQQDEHPLADEGSMVASATSACYIKAGWGVTIDLTDFTKFRAITPCPNNTFGVAADTFGLVSAPCKACSKNLKSASGSKSFRDCLNPDGFGYTSEGANQCPDSFWATAGSMAPCEPCPDGRYTSYVPRDGSWQSSIASCKIRRGYGIYSASAADPWNPEVLAASMNAHPCPIGFASAGDSDGLLLTENPVCKSCMNGTSSSDVGSATCDVCAPGYGGPPGTCTQCPYNTYQPGSETGDGRTCRPCTSSVYNHNVGDTFTSYGISFFKGMTNPYMCVPRFSQVPAPVGSILALPDSMFVADPSSTTVDACVKACPALSCCIAEFDDSGSCRRAVLAPSTPAVVVASAGSSTGSATVPMAKMYYKLPPSELGVMSTGGSLTENLTKSELSGLDPAAANMRNSTDLGSLSLTSGESTNLTTLQKLQLAKSLASGVFTVCDISRYQGLQVVG